MGFNITDTDEGKILYYDIKKDNLMLWINTVIHLQNNKMEFGIEFMNKRWIYAKYLLIVGMRLLLVLFMK